jgi:lysophospholipase L1-like esterase
MSSLKRIGASAVTLLLSLVLGLVLLEVGVRVFSPRKLFTATVNVWDRALGTKQIPGAEGFVVCGEYTMDLFINSKGLRDREFPYEKSEGVWRILCLGDSFTCGYGVQAEDTFAKVLEGLFNEDPDLAGDYEVINAGVGSTGTAHHLAYFKTEGYRYEPDFVLLCFCWANDFWDNVTCGLYSLEEGRLVKHDAPRTASRKMQVLTRLIPFYKTLCAKSHLLSLVKTSISRYHFRTLAKRSGAHEDESGILEKEKVLTRHLVASLHAACQDVGCELIVTVIPPRLGDTWDEETLDLVEYVTQQGIRFIDLVPAFWNQERRGIQDYHPRDGHWNASGHRLAAEVMYEFFVEG